jgi:hypothetical protein
MGARRFLGMTPRLPARSPVVGAADERSYVIYAPTPWDSPRQAAHNFAEALAVHHPVLYVDPPLSPLSPIRYGLRSWTVVCALAAACACLAR